MSAGRHEKDSQRQGLAERLREAREYVGISQDEAAASLGIARPAMTLIESGGRKVEAVELGKLAKLYGQDVETLLNGSTPEKDNKLAFLARATHGLSAADLEQLERFSEYLRNSAKSKRRE
jgi:transcriptional regulator with XRE-family HTH domain